MKWASAIATSGSWKAALDEVVSGIEATLGDARPDLLLLFASTDLAAVGDEIPARLHARFPGAVIVGSSGAGVIGAGHEEEDLPALALVAAHLPGVQLSTFQIGTLGLPAPSATPQEWHTTLGIPSDGSPTFLIFADPYTCDGNALLAGMDRAYPGSVKVGGFASGGRGAGRTRLYLNGNIWRNGAVGVALKGKLRVDTIVAQGCRPIGPPMLVTRCDGTVLLELNQRKPLEVLQEIHNALNEEEQAQFRTALLLGIEMAQESVEFHAGETLVRNVVGVDPRTGTIAVGTELKQFQVVQFMIRDADAAKAQLTRLLVKHQQAALPPPDGVLLFSCVGRGRGLFGREDHDSSLLRQHVGTVPLGGFFCDAEIGPVGGTTYMHKYTSAFVLFRPA